MNHTGRGSLGREREVEVRGYLEGHRGGQEAGWLGLPVWVGGGGLIKRGQAGTAKNYLSRPAGRDELLGVECGCASVDVFTFSLPCLLSCDELFEGWRKWVGGWVM